MVAVNYTFYGNHSTLYINQIFMLYTLNLHSDVCLLFLNKTGKKYNSHKNPGLPDSWTC